MPFLGNGTHQLNEMSPGALSWLAQINANLEALNDQNGERSYGTAGQALAPGDAVAFDTSDGKLYKCDPAGANHRFNFVGVCSTIAAINTRVDFVSLGEISYTHAFTAGTPLFMSGTPGLLTNSSAASTKVVAMARPNNKIWIAAYNCWIP